MDTRQSTTTAFRELRSEEVQEIISRPPQWILRWGMVLFFLVIVAGGFGTWLIRYPDIVSAPFSLTNADVPRKIIVRTDGKLLRLFVSDGQHVDVGEILGYSESIGDADQILKLQECIKKIYVVLRQENWNSIKHSNLQPYADLGELQPDFETFYQKFNTIRGVIDNGFYQKKRKLLVEDYDDLNAMSEVLREQHVLQGKDLELAEDEFRVQEKLYQNKVIANIEYKREKARRLAREIPLKNLASALLQNKAAKVAKQKEILELDNAMQEQKANFLQAVYSLNSSVAQWKKKYVLVAPVAGKISFSQPVHELEQFVNGQEIMTVEPLNTSYRGIVKLPQHNLGKIAVGQKVLIKLDGYPYREFGLIEGRLSQVSEVPDKDSVYWAYVELHRRLVTRYGRVLPYRNGLKGSAEIVTVDRRLAERFFSLITDGGVSFPKVIVE